MLQHASCTPILPAGPLKVLDLASGPGDPAIAIAQALPQAQVTATDLAPKMCELAAQRAKKLALTNFTAQPADAQDLQGFAGSSFDLVTCQYAIFALPDCDSALREVLRVLKPGGMFMATCWGEDADMMNVSSATSRLQPPTTARSSDTLSRRGTTHPWWSWSESRVLLWVYQALISSIYRLELQHILPGISLCSSPACDVVLPSMLVHTSAFCLVSHA